jgi:hypothetical protein
MNSAITQTYTVVTDKLELPRGAEFNVEPGPVETAELALVRIGEFETVGRYYHDIAGCDWIIQPGLLIQVVGNVPVQVVGPVLLVLPVLPCSQAA